jgi:CRISPR-associated protein Csb2
MTLALEQSFPLGRFHATRWNQSPFEDPYGEWPPSPWRLLRALAARWFQYSRETGQLDEALRDRLLNKLARESPAYRLPVATWRGVPIRQYHPTGVTWSDAQKKNPGYKRPGTTLVQDHYRAIPPGERIYWLWERTELYPDEAILLHQLLRRVLYFGRAESYCRFRILEGQEVTPNCQLVRTAGMGNAVLAPELGVALNLNALLASTDGDCVQDQGGYRVRDLLRQRRIPPGTVWLYAQIPPRPTTYRPAPVGRRRHPPGIQILQFAVGGRVYPPDAHWVKLAERFRDAMIRQRCLQVSGRRTHRYAELTAAERDALTLTRGLTGEGRRVDGRETVFFALTPDAQNLPTRLLCWRESPLTDDEIDAFLAASELPIRWEYGSDDWRVRLVPLPFSVPRPPEYWGPGRVWKSAAPFVLPAGLHRTRRGRQRPGETPEACIRKLLVRFGFPKPDVERLSAEPTWVTIHESSGEHRRRSKERGTRMRPGYRFRIIFPRPVDGPLCVGHSCHFGLGLFRRVE